MWYIHLSDKQLDNSIADWKNENIYPEYYKILNLGFRTTTLLNTSRSFTNNHFVTVLGTLGTRFPRTGTLSAPTPDRHGIFIGLGFSTSTTVWMVVTIRVLSVVHFQIVENDNIRVHSHTTNRRSPTEPT